MADQCWAARLRCSRRWGALGGSASAVEPEVAAHVIRQIGKTDLHPRPRQANGTDHQSHRSLLISKHMLDGGAYCGLAGIGSPGTRRHRTALRLLAMNA